MLGEPEGGTTCSRRGQKEGGGRSLFKGQKKIEENKEKYTNAAIQ